MEGKLGWLLLGGGGALLALATGTPAGEAFFGDKNGQPIENIPQPLPLCKYSALGGEIMATNKPCLELPTIQSSSLNPGTLTTPIFR